MHTRARKISLLLNSSEKEWDKRLRAERKIMKLPAVGVIEGDIFVKRNVCVGLSGA